MTYLNRTARIAFKPSHSKYAKKKHNVGERTFWDEIFSDIVKARPGPRRKRHMGFGLHIADCTLPGLRGITNVVCFQILRGDARLSIRQGIRRQSPSSDCTVTELMARGQGLLEAACHMPWTLSWGLASVCGPRPHCCPVILDVLALRA